VVQGRAGGGTFSGLRTAIGLLTRLPIRSGVTTTSGMLAWFPAVGVLVGGVGAVVWLAVGAVTSAPVAAVAAVAATVAVTGAFHLDGLADTCDALIGGRDAEHRRVLLDDPRHGTYGVVAVVLQLLAQWALLAGLPAAAGAAALVMAHCAARAGVVWATLGARPLDAGLGAAVLRARRGSDLAAAALWAAVIVIGTASAPGLGVLAAAALAAFGTRVWGQRRLGGVNGDVLGAAEQIGETAALVAVVVSVNAGWEVPWWVGS
jgi:adenosylcobinamide-GDP ribazoletransferase